MNFFVMMNSQNGNFIFPLLVEDEFGNTDVLMFETEEEAIMAAEQNPYCRAFGYEVFERGTGTCK